MLSKQEHINHWIEQAEDDWKAVNTLFSGHNFLQSLFFVHLVIEKICKAVWIFSNDANIPPRTHNLVYILSQTSVSVPDDINEFLLSLNRFQMEGRYPEHIDKMRKICTPEFTTGIINKANETKIWLLGKLQ